MDKVLITGLLVTASVITAMILFGVFRTSIQESGSSARGLQDQASLQAETGIAIMEVIAVDNGTVFDIWSKNTGYIEILPKESIVFTISDINGTVYGSIENSDDDPLISPQYTWQIESNFNALGESIDNTDSWGPGGTLQVRAKLILVPVESRDYILSINVTGDLYANHIFKAPSSLP
jgi:hypothetical protein